MEVASEVEVVRHDSVEEVEDRGFVEEDHRTDLMHVVGLRTGLADVMALHKRQAVESDLGEDSPVMTAEVDSLAEEDLHILAWRLEKSTKGNQINLRPDGGP